MKEIPLSQGLVALVDDEDFEELSQYRWCAYWDPVAQTYYAHRNGYTPEGKATVFLMHRQIMQTPRGMLTHHENHNGLDNRRQNLRVLTHSQHGMRQRKQRCDRSSVYKGVSWHKACQKWTAQIKRADRLVYLGLFTSEQEAAMAYNRAASEHFGEYAHLNQVVKSGAA